jgi:hypothetical protein
MGLLSQITGGVINDDGPIISGWNNPFQGGPIIPGVDNPFQSADKAWLPGAGQLNPLNSDSAVGKAVKDLGQLNVFNPDTTAGKVTQNIVADIGKDPVKWAAYAVAIAAGQPQLIPYISGVAKVTSKNSSPEEWLTEGIKAYAIQAGGDWLANNVAGLGPQTDITTGQTFAGTGVRGATDSAMAARVAANSARGMFVTAAQKGTTDINGAQIITNSLTSDGLNQAMAQIPGWNTLTKAEQATAVDAFKVAFNRDQSAAYNLLNQGFTTALNTATKEALDTGYKSLADKVKITDEVYSKGTAEDRKLLNDAETDYKTAAENLEQLRGMGPSQGQIDQAQGELEDLRRGVERVSDDVFFKSKGYEGYGDFSRAANSGVDDPEVWKQIKAIEAKGGDDAATAGNAMAAYLTAQNKARSLSSDPNRDEAALAQAIEDMDAAAQAVRRLPDEINAKSKTTNVVDDLTNAGLHDDLDDTDLTKVVGGTDTAQTKPAGDERLSQAIEKGKSGDLLGQINMQREIVGLPPYSSLDEYYATKEGKKLLDDQDDGDDTATVGIGAGTGAGADATAKPDERLSQAIEKAKAGDLLGEINLLREIVGYAPFATLEEYYASKNAEDGDDTLESGTGADTLTGGTGNDTVAGGDPFAYYDPETKQYKYGANHGDFNPFNFGLTEEQFLSSGDPWAVYDPDTGQYQYSIGDPNFDPYKYDLVDDDPTNDYKFKLPTLPGGKKPEIRPRPKPKPKPDTTTTTTTTTAPAAPNMALFALLASLGNQQAPAPAPVIDTTPSEPFDFTSEFEVNPYAKQRSASKMAQGGSIDELLDILRRN